MKKFFTNLLILIILFVSCCYTANARENYIQKIRKYRVYVREAQKFEKKGEIIRANEQYLKAEELFPERYEVKFGLAKTYGWLKEKELAQKYYDELLETNPDNVDLLDAYADFLRETDEYDKATEIYARLYEKTKNETYRVKIAEVLVLKKDYKAALEIYSDVYKKEPHNTEVLKSIAYLYFLNGNFKKSSEFYAEYFKYTKSPDTASELKYAQSLFYSKQPEKAEKILGKLIEKQPTNIDALNTLAEVYLSEKKQVKAINILSKIISTEPNNMKARNSLANIYISNKEYKKAEKILQENLELQPDDPQTQKNMAFLYFIKGNFKKSAELYKSYLAKSDVKDPESEINYAKSLFYSGNPIDATAILEKYAQKDPENTDILITLAEVYLATDKAEKAINILLIVIELEPQNMKARNSLAQAYIITKKYTEAERLLLENLKLQPNNLNIQKKLAFLYFMSGKFEKSASLYKLYLDKTKKEDPEAELYYAKSLFYSGKTKEAEKILKDIVKKYSDNADALNTLAETYQALNDPKKAIDVLSEIVSLQPKNLKAKNALAQAYIWTKKYPDAEKLLLEILELQPENTQTLKNLASLYFMTGEFKKSAEFYGDYLAQIKTEDPESELNYAKSLFYSKNPEKAKKILEKYPDNIDAQTTLAEIYQGFKQPQKAIKILAKLMRLQPENIKIKNTLANLYITTKDYKQAEKLLLEIIKTKPDDLLSQKNLAFLYFMTGRFKDSANIYSRYFAKIKTEDPDSELNYGKSLFYSGNKEKARNVLKTFVKKYPSNIDALSTLGELHLALNDSFLSLDALKKAVSLNPNDIKARNNLANTYVAIHQYEDAERTLLETLGIQPENLQAQKQLAYLYFITDRFDAAVLVYQHYMERITEPDPDSELNYGKSLFYSKMPEAARIVIEKYVEKYPVDIDALTTLGDIYLALDKPGFALNIFKKAEYIDPENLNIKIQVARALRSMEKYGEAELILLEILGIERNNSLAQKELAYLYFIRGKYLKANNFYEIYLAREDDVESQINYAKSLFYTKNTGKAGILLEKITSSHPDNVEALITLAEVYLALERPVLSYEIISKAELVEPDSIKVQIQKAKTYIALENDQNAFIQLSKVLTYHPDNTEALVTLGKLYLANDKPENALPLFSQAKLLEPENIQTTIQVAKAHIASKNYNDAKYILHQLEKINTGRDDDIYNKQEVWEYLGDISSFESDFPNAINYYGNIPGFNSNSRIIHKMAQSRQYNKDLDIAENLYISLLYDPEYNTRAKIGLAEVRINRGIPLKARKILKELLLTDPDNIQAKKNLGITYMATGDNLKAIEIFEKLPKDDEDIALQLAKAYNNIGRDDLALDLLKNNSKDSAYVLKGEIESYLKPGIGPLFEQYHESGYNANAVEWHKIGGLGYFFPRPNIRVAATARQIEYRSTKIALSTKAVNMLLEVDGRPTNNLAYSGEAAVQVYANGGTIVVGDSLFSYHPNDFLTWDFGFERVLDEIDSYMSAAGVVPDVGPYAGNLVGRIIRNRFFLANLGVKLPYESYAYGGFNVAFAAGSNSPPNFYKDAPAGIGKIIASGPAYSPVEEAILGYDFYYMAYNVDRSGYGGANIATPPPIGSDNQSPYPSTGNPGVGGYFSPTFFISNKFALRMKGFIKQLLLNYYVSAYGGTQTIQGEFIIAGNQPGRKTYPFYGIYVAGKINEKGRLGLNGYYEINNYRTVIQNRYRLNLIYRF